MNHKRKIAEMQYQETFHIIKTIECFEKDWKHFTLDGSGCVVNITTLGCMAGFEAFIDGKAFDDYIRPALENALLATLERKKDYLNFQISEIDNILTKRKNG